jgi:hypothetical protein
MLTPGARQFPEVFAWEAAPRWVTCALIVVTWQVAGAGSIQNETTFLGCVEAAGGPCGTGAERKKPGV